MPARKPKPKRPATKEGRKLRSQVSKAKLGNRKIVEKTKTGKKKTIHSRSGELKKTVETKKVRTRKPALSKGNKKSGIPLKVSVGVGTAAGAAVGYGKMKKATKGIRVGQNTRTDQIGDKVSMSTIASRMGKPNPQPKGKMPKYPKKYTGSNAPQNNAAKAMGVVSGAMVGSIASMAGSAVARKIKNSLSKSRTKTKKQRIVNGVNKTAQRQKVKSTRQAMRTKKKNIRRR